MTVLTELKAPVAQFFRKFEVRRRVADPPFTLTFDVVNSVTVGVVNGIAVDSTHAYLVGYDTGGGGGTNQFRIEKRDLVNGSLTFAYTNQINTTTVPSISSCQYDSVAVDATGIYVAGWNAPTTGITQSWHISRHDLVNASITWSSRLFAFTASNPALQQRASHAIVSGNYLYVAGNVIGDGAMGYSPTGGVAAGLVPSQFPCSFGAAFPTVTTDSVTNLCMQRFDKTNGSVSGSFIRTNYHISSAAIGTNSTYPIDMVLDADNAPYILSQIIRSSSGGPTETSANMASLSAIYKLSLAATNAFTIAACAGTPYSGSATMPRALSFYGGDLYVGYSDSGAVQQRLSLGKYNSALTLLWHNRIGTTKGYDTTGTYVNDLLVNTNGAFLTGRYSAAASDSKLLIWWANLGPSNSAYVKSTLIKKYEIDYTTTSIDSGIAIVSDTPSLGLSNLYVAGMANHTTTGNWHFLAIKQNSEIGRLEETWQDLTQYVKQWGTIRSELDNSAFNVFRQVGVSLICQNDTGLFDKETNVSSFWNGFLSRYNTLVRIKAGFISSTDNITELPDGSTNASTTIQFVGLMAEPAYLTGDNEVMLNIRPIQSVMENVPATHIINTSNSAVLFSLTASDILARIRDITLGAMDFPIRKYISTAAWNIDATTELLRGLATTTILDAYDCLGLGQELAVLQNKVFVPTRQGGINFISRTPTSVVSFIFSGDGFNPGTYGHTIKALTNYYEDIEFMKNQIYIRYDTTTTLYTITTNITSSGIDPSDIFGFRGLSINAEWLQTTTAANNLASQLSADLGSIKERVNLRCKFIPILNLLDRTQIQYSPGDNTTFDFTGKDYKIIGLEHNLDTAETNVTLREI